jgi:hypothetical protein
MKHFALISVGVFLIGAFFELTSKSPNQAANADQRKVYSMVVTDTVPKKNDTLNKRMPRDTTTRKDTLMKRDSLQ